MAVQRMMREERRLQLLDVATQIIRTEGTDALTLVHLAEKAEISRPIVYDHFKTREGLLMALWEDYDRQIGAAISQAMKTQSVTLTEVATAFSSAYIDGTMAAGPECEEVSAALSGTTATRDFRQRSSDFYVAEFGKALLPFVQLSTQLNRALLLGIFSAVEGLARAAAARQLSPLAAVEAATKILVATIEPLQKDK